MNEFTAGPWETSRDAVPDGHTQITVYAESTGHRVATVFQTPANARLIKAAPNLFEALELCRELLDSSEVRYFIGHKRGEMARLHEALNKSSRAVAEVRYA